MAKPLKAEIKQRKPFASPQAEAFVNLQRTADRLLEGVEKTLKRESLSPTQYNVLRILRGSAPDGLACREVGDRMITRDPDITRLLDRLEAQGLISRARDTGDRRVVRTKITAKGSEILRRLDEPVEGLHLRQLGHLSAKQLRTLCTLLDTAREKAL